MNQYTQQSLVRMTASIVTLSGAQINPSAFTLRLMTPDGVITDITSTLVNDSIGNYHADYITSQVGLHQYEFLGTGSAQVASIGQFLVSQGTF